MKPVWGIVWAVAFGVVFGLLAAGLLWLSVRPPVGRAIQLQPLSSPPPLVVHVSGAVVQPGVCSLAPGSRMQDAIAAAGGLMDTADDQALNLAAPVHDGDLIRVPFKRTAASDQPLPDSETVSTTTQDGFDDSFSHKLVNVNTASQEELETLPGIGPVTAQKIIAYREAHGFFQAIENIQDVSGIGPVTFERIKDLITVTTNP